ncbi:MAG: RNA polymerase sigma-54 factor [Planctomycetota bacterium]|nr:MAG: RNA polymerase sigma-54 factor [Planctomycetota bacterium]
MRMDLSQNMRAEMRMKMAPRMIQSMEILQMPLLALQERIDQELNDNPLLLDMNEAEPGEAEIYKPDGTVEKETSSSEEPLLQADQGPSPETPAVESAVEAPVEDVWEEDFYDFDEQFREPSSLSRGGLDELSERKLEALMNTADRPPTLQDHLEEQLTLLDLTDEQKRMAEFIINNLDERGYLTVSIHEIARESGHAVMPTEVEVVLKWVQAMDPPGVAARTLKECLLLQVTDEHPMAREQRILIEHHLEDIQHNRLPLIEKKTGILIPKIKEAIEQIRRLDPRPGSQFQASHNDYVIPDFYLENKTDGGYKVCLVDDSLPQLGVSRCYSQLARSKGVDVQTREYLHRKLQAARWLIEAIEQRRGTLVKVAQEIVDRQQKFIDFGDEFLEPLKMQQIADRVGVHVTTISRAVDDKWMSTPRGIYPLKRFFKGGTTTADGDEMAWDTIKQMLSELIAKEDKRKPMSDEDIVESFKSEGITIARRTVTKYRESMHIPSSRQRKSY